MKLLIIKLLLLSCLFADAFNGYTLFSPVSNGPGGQNNFSYLIDNDENIINQWVHESAPGSFPYLLPDSTILYPGKASNPSMLVAASGGRILQYDWDGEILWDFNWSDENHLQHHDIEPLPNGNILLISNERISYDEAVSLGRVDIEGEIWPDMIVEIQPTGLNTGNIVWEWHVWDHLIQDTDSEKPNYGAISEHPERIDINQISIAGSHGNGPYNGDWLHANAVHYNAQYDQVILSCRRSSEFYVFDHSTTTEEASSSSGGQYNKGGDILYRWGNPQNYGRGSENDQQITHQHGVNWVPQGYPGEGNILIFNNGSGESSVLEIVLPYLENGDYMISENDAFEPTEPSWTYSGNGNSFFSDMQSGVFRLPNGNTLITVADDAHIFEVNQEGEIEWDFQSGGGNIARAKKYGIDYLNQLVLGDVNNDQVVNVQDIIILVNIIIGEIDPVDFADLNNDEIINVLDILLIVNIIVSE